MNGAPANEAVPTAYLIIESVSFLLYQDFLMQQGQLVDYFEITATRKLLNFTNANLVHGNIASITRPIVQLGNYSCL
jgi:hypothetical protein